MTLLNGKKSGFTLIELVIIISMLGILAVLAMPAYADLSDDAKESAERGVVGSVRSGLTQHSSALVLDGTQFSYPSKLDSESDNTEASDATPLFVIVIKGGVTQDWIKLNDTEYEGPTGTRYEYSSLEGSFMEKTTLNLESM